MKIKYLLLTFGLGILVSSLIITKKNSEKLANYVPRQNNILSNESIKGAELWMNRIKSNQITGTVSLDDIQKVENQIKASRLAKNRSIGLEWNEMGPDNVGGRTRAILIDKDDPNLIFAGGVSGGLWKSQYGGSSWEQVNYSGDELSNNINNLAVTSICQTANGDIYFGTGEGIWGSFHGTNSATPLISGQGIWKSTDKGSSWTRLASTWTTSEQKNAFVGVNKLEADPNNANTIYAATVAGLRVTTDGGQTWSNPLDASFFGYAGNAKDVEIGSSGNIIASVNDIAYLKLSGGTWQSVSNDLANNPDSVSDKLPTDAGRLEFDISETNPNYVYCCAAKSDETLYNIYQSTDGGLTWSIIGPGGSEEFQPLGELGKYANILKVSPYDEQTVFVAGLDLWIWTAGTTWFQLSYHNFPEFHPLYLHADQHEILFHPTDSNLFFFGSDGGLTKLQGGNSNLSGFSSLNRNYNVTQFYTVGFDGDGKVIGGTQDNGTQYIDFLGNSEQESIHILGGDGGGTVISQLNPKIMFVTSQYGRLQRTNNYTAAEMGLQYFYSDKQLEDHAWTAPGHVDVGVDPAEGAFVTPIALWETHNDELADDSIEFICKRHYDAGETLIVKSHNIYDFPMYHKLEKDYEVNDTIYTKDPYGSLLVLGLARQLWVTRMGTNFNEMPGRWGWWRMLPEGFLDYTVGGVHSTSDEKVEHVAITKDGNSIFFSTSRNKLYRVTNITQARTRNNADMVFVSPNADPPITMDDKVIEVQQIHDFGSRTVTDIYCDPQAVENVLVTLGNFNNSDYVYYSTNAVTTTSTEGNFFSIQGNLPQMPVYSGIIHYDDSAKVIVGSEYGIWACEDIFAANTVWTEENSGMDNLPTMMVRQQIWPNWRPGINNNGFIYAATYGRGIYKSETLKGPVSVKENGNSVSNLSEAKIYPNPVTTNATIKYSVFYPSEVSVSIYDISGRLVFSRELGIQNMGSQEMKINTSNFAKGSYFVNVSSGKSKTTAKFIKY